MTRRRTTSPLLSVLTTPGPSTPWVSEHGAFRIVPNPRLGLPLIPFPVLIAETEPSLHDVFQWRLVGDARGHDVDGTAWLVLRVVDPEQIGPPLVDVTLDHVDGAAEVAVVRTIGDRGVGLFTRSQPPYRLTAPSITVVRIRGRCTVAAVRIVDTAFDLESTDRRLLGLPIDATWPNYHGTGGAKEEAFTRVMAGAADAPAPHETDPGLAPADREHARVMDMVAPWLEPTLEELIQLPIADRLADVFLPDPSGLPRPDRAIIDRMGAVMAAATDPGIGRWLGLIDAIGRRDRTAVLTVGGVWAVEADNRLCEPIRLTSRPDRFIEWFGHLYDPQVIADLRELEQSTTLLWAWTQAWVDFDCPPDPPPAPVLVVGAPARWTSGAQPDDDTAAVPVEASGTAALGLLGVLSAPGTAPVMPPLESAGGLVRPLLAHEGTAFVSTFAAPFDTNEYDVFQSDAFGRWSETSTHLSVACPARPDLATPDPMVSLVREVPTGTAPWVPTLRVEVVVPKRTPGRPAVTEVVVTLDGVEHVAIQASAGQLAVSNVAGPSLAVGAESIASVSVTFRSVPGGERTATRRVTIRDPRAPAPPPPDPVLRFASRSDATGMAAAVISLPDGDHVAGYFVERASEVELAAASNLQTPSGASRDARARFWLDHAAAVTSAFARPSPDPVPIANRRAIELLPGDLSDLVAIRLVPLGGNGASTRPADCPFTLFAVPRSTEPPPPVLRVDRAGAPRLVIRRRAGGVLADRFRVRMAVADHGDPRAAPVVASGTFLDDDAVGVPLPPLRPFAQVTLFAEVRGEDERGVTPMPGRWSRASSPIDYVAVPPDPPSFVTAAGRDGSGVALTVDAASTPADGSGYQVELFRRDPASGAFVSWGDPLSYSERVDAGAPLPADDLVVVVIDPLRRRSTPIAVA
jgi:hypothetical protein